MLLLSTRSITVDGVTVFPDHADDKQYWYLPAPVSLAKMPDSDEPQFLLIMYAPDVAGTGVKGTGFLNVTTALTLADDTRQTLIGQIKDQFDVDEPRLAPVPFDEGSVQVVTLDLQGGGGTVNTAPPGSFVAVEKILGAVNPSLYGDNDALFALTLSEDGATILKAAFENGMAPVGAIYNLKFTGVRPALDVKITADLKRCYSSFSVGLSASIYFVSAGIDATFEKLRQDGSIKVEVVSLSNDAETAAAEQQAMALFKDQILSQWFTPSLSPTTAQAADVGVPPLPSQGGAGAGAGTARPPTGGTSASPSGAMGAAAGAMGGAMGGAHPPTPAGGMGTPPPAGGMGAPPPSGAAAHPAPSPSGAAPSPSGAAAHPAPSPTGAAPAPSGAAPAAPAAAAPAAPRPPAPAQAAPPPAQSAAHPAAGALPAAAAGAAGAAAGASQAASPFGISLRLKYVSQDEQKTVTYEYNRMDAVQRTYAPQGYFGLMLGKIDKSKHFLEVDGTDPFFKDFSVTVAPPRDFTTIGLQRAHVAVDYGDPTNSAGVKHGEFVFDGTSSVPQVWDVYQGLIRSTEYRYAVDYAFDPESGWNGESDKYQLPTVTTENRQLTLDPRDTLGFLAISIVPGHIDAATVDRIDVSLHYQSKTGWQNDALVTLRPGDAAKSWKLRLSDKTDNSYTYSTRCTLKDGTVFDAPAVTSTATTVFVNDPFAGGAINITVQPTLDATKTKLAILEIAYSDPDCNYNFQPTFQLQPGAASQHVHIPIVDRAKNSFQYRITTVSASNQQTKGAYVTTQDTLVLVGDTP